MKSLGQFWVATILGLVIEFAWRGVWAILNIKWDDATRLTVRSRHR